MAGLKKCFKKAKVEEKDRYHSLGQHRLVVRSDGKGQDGGHQSQDHCSHAQAGTVTKVALAKLEFIRVDAAAGRFDGVIFQATTEEQHGREQGKDYRMLEMTGKEKKKSDES